MAGEATNRRAELIEYRSTIELALRAIDQKLPVPADALPYLKSRMGSDGSLLDGASASELLMKHLKIVVDELRQLPFIGISRVAQVVRVDGRDLSEYVN